VPWHSIPSLFQPPPTPNRKRPDLVYRCHEIVGLDSVALLHKLVQRFLEINQL